MTKLTRQGIRDLGRSKPIRREIPEAQKQFFCQHFWTRDGMWGYYICLNCGKVSE